MKRQLKREVVPKLVVTVEVDYELTDIAAVRLVNTPDSISSKHKLESVYEDILDDVALTVLNTVVSYEFEVTETIKRTGRIPTTLSFTRWTTTETE